MDFGKLKQIVNSNRIKVPISIIKIMKEVGCSSCCNMKVMCGGHPSNL